MCQSQRLTFSMKWNECEALLLHFFNGKQTSFFNFAFLGPSRKSCLWSFCWNWWAFLLVLHGYYSIPYFFFYTQCIKIYITNDNSDSQCTLFFSGSVLLSCSHFGAHVMGSDIDHTLLHGRGTQAKTALSFVCLFVCLYQCAANNAYNIYFFTIIQLSTSTLIF